MEPVWGQLDKAQDDNEKIGEAIDAAIAAHEADSDAHLGSGESLESHKDSEVIDHLAGSIPQDKFSNSERKFETYFENLSRWLTRGDVTNTYIGQLNVYTVDSATSRSSIWPEYALFPGQYTLADNFVFDVSCYFDPFDDAVIDVYGGSTSALSFGFEASPSGIRGFYTNGSSVIYTPYFTITPTQVVTLRVLNDSVSKYLKFIINGTEEKTLSYTTTTAVGSASIMIDNNVDTDGEGNISVSRLALSVF